MATLYEEQSNVFKAFCDEKRLRILELLRGGEKCACVLIEQMDMPQSTLSYHMKLLCESGIVDYRQDGKWTHYRISETGSLKALALLKELTGQSGGEDPTPRCCGVPSPGEDKESFGCCSGGGKKSVLVEYLYLDLKTCERCIGTEDQLDEVIAALAPSLAFAGYSIDYKKIEIASAEMATQYRFLSSPTIRVNGRDICQNVAESDCASCREISGTDVHCRVFEYESSSYEVPPKDILADAILKSVFGAEASGSRGDYVLPENLRQFFEGKEAKASKYSCKENCR